MSTKEKFSFIIKSVYEALACSDVERMLSFYKEDATVEWASFKFKGKNEIKRWAAELRQMFHDLKFRLGPLEVLESNASNKLVMEVTTLDGRKGWMPGESKIRFKDGKVQFFQLTFSEGYILIKKEDVPLPYMRPSEP